MLKIGVIGAGHLGKIHLRLIKEIKDFNLIGFYDHNAEHSRDVATELSVQPLNSVEDVIDKCDVIDVVTPTLSHYSIAEKALRAGRHVFIEKPLSNTLEEAKSLIAFAHEADVKVHVGHVERFNPAFIAACEYCVQPMFIESHRLAEFNPRGTDVPVVIDLMIHDIDIVLSVVKSNVKRISASGVAVVSDTPDIANARIEFDNGCVANLTASRVSLKKMRKMRFFQRDAYISVDFLTKEATVVRMKQVENGENNPFGIVVDLGDGKGKKQIYMENPLVANTNAIKTELEMFAKCIIENTTPIVTIDDGYNALRVAHQIMDKFQMMTQ